MSWYRSLSKALTKVLTVGEVGTACVRTVQCLARDGYGLSEGRSRCDKKTAKGNTSGNASNFHWRKAIDEVDKEERSVKKPFNSPDRIFETKLDGFRAIAVPPLAGFQPTADI
jgi:hypothetical protein